MSRLTDAQTADTLAKEKTKAKNDALTRRKRAALAAWPDGAQPPKNEKEWEETFGGTGPNDKDKQLWDDYVAANAAYQKAVLESDLADLDSLDKQELVHPNSHDGDDWDATGSGYVGYFHARGAVNTKSKTSWANVTAREDIKKEKVDQIDIKKALELAQLFDHDIDGKSSTGTSIVKEGEEKFTVGASYSGVQGVSVTEISGLSAAYIRGKKVLCTDGDSWTWQTGADYIFYADLDEYRYTNEVKNLRKTKISSGENRTFSRADGADSTTKLAGGTITNTNVGSTLFTFNGAGIIGVTNASAVQATCNISGCVTSVGLHISATSHLYSVAPITAVAMSCISLLGFNTAPTRVITDNTSVTALIYTNHFLNSAANTLNNCLGQINLALTSLGVTTVAVADEGQRIHRTKTAIESIAMLVRDRDIALEADDVYLHSANASIVKQNLAYEKRTNAFESSESAVYVTNFSINL